MAKRIEVTEVKILPGDRLQVFYIPETTQVLQAGKKYEFVFKLPKQKGVDHGAAESEGDSEGTEKPA